MHRCSNTIGAIAGALAKAQAELTNPEKSLTATIAAPGPRGSIDRTFRYASLSSGLDIVRKSLGRHEIAAVQTTAIDTEAGLLRLTTVLAHSSGEWISSEWPVCPVSETAVPHRMGAALTYARRYALFTLVGIAGEDDLDAPDTGPAQEAQGEAKVAPAGSFSHRGNGRIPANPRPGNGYSRKPPARRSVPLMPPTESAAARDNLIADLGPLASADELSAWAYRQMPTKNTLRADDAGAVEAAFTARLRELGSTAIEASDVLPSDPAIEASAPLPAGEVESPTRRTGIDKSVLAISEPRRHRDEAHLKFVALQACLVCGRQPSDPHHLGFAQPRALGRKVSDEFAVPLCRTHHRQVHRSGNEPTWWKQYNLDPLAVASAFWEQRRSAQPTEQTASPEQITKEAAAAASHSAASHSRFPQNRKMKPLDPAGAR